VNTVRLVSDALASLRFRLILPALAILVLSTVALTLYGAGQLKERIEVEKRATLERLSTTLASACELPVNVGDISALEAIARSVADEPDVAAFRVIGEHGESLVSYASPGEAHPGMQPRMATVARTGRLLDTYAMGRGRCARRDPRPANRYAYRHHQLNWTSYRGPELG